jgi:hypothetical protein
MVTTMGPKNKFQVKNKKLQELALRSRSEATFG